MLSLNYYDKKCGPTIAVFVTVALGLVSSLMHPDTEKLDQALKNLKANQARALNAKHEILDPIVKNILNEINQILKTESNTEAQFRLKALINSEDMIDFVTRLEYTKSKVGNTPIAEGLIKCLYHCYPSEVNEDQIQSLRKFAEEDNRSFWTRVLSHTNKVDPQRIVKRSGPVA